MPRINAIWMLTLLAVLALVAGACSNSSQPPQSSDSLGLGAPDTNLTTAENFVKNSPTFKYDGIPETLKLSDTVPMDNRIQYVFEFDCRHAGYGDRTGQALAQVIEHHVAMIIVENGQVISALLDGHWDMIHQKDLNLRGT
jgi:hypothetical protein